MAETLAEPATRTGDECFLSDMARIGDLPNSVKRDLQVICRRRLFSCGETVAEAGEPSEFVGIVREGILRMQKSLPDGREHVVGLLIEGDMFGLVFGGPLHFAIEAATDAEIYIFGRASFEKIVMSSMELDRLLLLNLMNELDRARDWMVILSLPKIRARLSGFLIVMCARFQKIDHLITISRRAIRVRIPISRPDLAHLLGTRVESISRALHALADDGLIEILQPDLVEIRDLAALSEETGELDLGDPASLQRLVRALRTAQG